MTETNGGLAIALGIGINLKSSNFPPELVETATSVEAETNRTPDADALLKTLTRQFAELYFVLTPKTAPKKSGANGRGGRRI
jgi:biotin-(acetyl-CoA carboxylase) ligase